MKCRNLLLYAFLFTVTVLSALSPAYAQTELNFGVISTDASAAMKANPEGPKKNMQPFLSVLQHSSEHYGLLVAYYRANGLVPPDSRPKK